MKTRTPLLVFGCFILVSIPNLLSLDAHWASDESRWLRRSAGFMESIGAGRFSETDPAYPPGVTTMWIAMMQELLTGRVRLLKSEPTLSEIERQSTKMEKK